MPNIHIYIYLLLFNVQKAMKLNLNITSHLLFTLFLVSLESPPPDDPTEEANDAQKEDTSDATECVSDAAAKPDTTPDATKEELVSDERFVFVFIFI